MNENPPVQVQQQSQILPVKSDQKRGVGRPKLDFEGLGLHRTKDPVTNRPTKLYSKWQSMKARCYQASHPANKYYKVKNIGVCPEWVNNFQQFAKDMGEPPEGYTLERIDNDLGYSPGNCKWATWKDQAANRTQGGKKNIDPWSLRQRALRTDIGYHCVYQRVRNGWTEEAALTTPKF